VVALDLSPRMIEIGKARSRSHTNVTFLVGDATRWSFPVEAFDCVVSIATLHHLPIAETLQKMKRALKAGGVLAVLDLYESDGWRDVILGAVAVPASVALRLIRTGRLRKPRPERQAWAAHGRNDTYSTLARVRQTCEQVLPGARVRKHLLWRYSIVWHKPARPAPGASW